MIKNYLIKNAAAIVTCDDGDQVFYDADILTNGPAIAAIGKNLPAGEAEVIDGRNKFVYPGLINTHHHFFQTFVRNMMSIDYPNMLVVEWLDKIYRIFQKIDDEVIYYSSLTAMSDLVKHGCTCAFDHQYCYTKATGNKPVDRQMEAAKQLGIRYHAGRGTNTLPRSLGSTIPDDMLETTDDFLTDCERIIGLYHDTGRFAMSRIAAAPCQPINSHRETFMEALSLARSKGVYLHTHLGEGENDIMLDRWGKRTLEWCEEIGFIGPDIWFAHGWELTAEEFMTLARYGSGISHCPAPTVLGGFPILDMGAMLKEGVTVSLGCDGSATNDSSSMLDTLRMAYLMQAYHSKSRGGCLSPYDVLKMATVNGAKTLGREDIGSLEPGKGADLFMIDTNVLELTGTLHDPKNILARAGITGPVWLTMINGKTVFCDGQLTGVDEEVLVGDSRRAWARFNARLK